MYLSWGRISRAFPDYREFFRCVGDRQELAQTPHIIYFRELSFSKRDDVSRLPSMNCRSDWKILLAGPLRVYLCLLHL